VDTHADVSSEWERRIAELNWYHTFDLPGGHTTVAFFDHRTFVQKLPIPADLSGQRCLDVGAADGFFGFEMARRGASEVVSLDLADLTQSDFRGATAVEDRGLEPHLGRANRCFSFVKEATGLDVDRVDGSVYDLPDLGLGTFDLVFIGNLLLHLQDPIRALRAAAAVTRGQLLSVEPITMTQTLLRPRTPTAEFAMGHDMTFWVFNKAGHRALLEAAGFAVERTGGPILQPLGRSMEQWPSLRELFRGPREFLTWTFTRQLGKLTSWVIASPQHPAPGPVP
jgi:tRNA (mo5U34)-methyltransferase